MLTCTKGFLIKISSNGRLMADQCQITTLKVNTKVNSFTFKFVKNDYVPLL